MATAVNQSVFIGYGAADEVDLYDQILRLRDEVLAGSHPSIRLSPAATAALAAALQENASDGKNVARQSQLTNRPNGPLSGAEAKYPIRTLASQAVGVSNPTREDTFRNSAGISAFAAVNTPRTPNSISLEKSDGLLRAEGRLKRQRIERELQAQVEQRRQTWRDKEHGMDGEGGLDITGVLSEALLRVAHVSGFKPPVVRGHEKSRSFDTNDYYSSQAPSEWSSDGEVTSKDMRPDPVVDVIADTSNSRKQNSIPEVLHFTPLAHATATASTYARPVTSSHVDGADEIEDDDDYVPPDPVPFGVSNGKPSGNASRPLDNMLDDDADDESEYEPGEISQDSQVVTPFAAGATARTMQPSSAVPVIRNHLTHIVAPQPSRVSPLATAKGPSINVAVVDSLSGAARSQAQPSLPVAQGPSRPSSASPMANGSAPSHKKKRNKKRKRDRELAAAATTKRQKNRDKPDLSLTSPFQHEPRIKDEPKSPIPFSLWQDAIRTVAGDTSSDLASPAQFNRPVDGSHVFPQTQFVPELNLATPPNLVTAPTPPPYRPHQRDTNDLRRIATLQHAQHPVPQQSYAQSTPRVVAQSLEYHPSRPLLTPVPDSYQNVRNREPRQYDDDRYQRNASEVVAAPAASDPFVLVDQWGRRYYREPDRPTEYRPQPTVVNDQPPVHLRAPLGAPLTSHHPSYARPDSVMDQSRHENPWNNHTSRLRDLSTPVAQPVSHRDGYRAASFQPAFQPNQRHAMPPPSSIPPSYDPNFGHSSRAQSTYVDDRASVRYDRQDRQASAVPLQYVRQEVPTSVRAMSVVPQAAQSAQQPYHIAPISTPIPPPMRYVDQYGQEVYPREVRQVAGPRF